LSLGMRLIAFSSLESSSDATVHAPVSVSMGLVGSDDASGGVGQGVRGTVGWLFSVTARSVPISGAWIGGGADTRGGLGAAFALKNEWSVWSGFATGLGKVRRLRSARQAFDAR
jgi:hypothetical protein